MSSRANAPSNAPSAKTPARNSPGIRLAIGLGLFIIVLGVYLATLSPGVGHGDIAELQWVAPQLGICHPPGYPLIVCAGWLVAHIPLGPSIAWRLNLFTAICAAVACVLLYDALARITQRVVPAVVGAATLAFSAIFWMHALESEVYAFYALLLLGGIYCGVRFFLAGRVAWFMAAALLLGACVSNRVSEVFVLPALPLAWLAFRHTARLTVGRLALAAVLFLLPSGFTLGFYLLRQDPNALYLRDNLLRDKLIEPQSRPFSELSAWEKLQDAVSYSLALKWQHVVVGDQRAELVQLPWQLDKLGWLLSGAGAIQDRFPTETEENRWRKLEQTPGAAIGLPGLLLALAALILWRRAWGWLVLGSAVALGGFAFYLFHRPPDNLEFTIPLLVGLSLLVGLGAAGQPPSSASRGIMYRALPWIALLVPISLLAGNWRIFAKSAAEVRAAVDEARRIAAAPLPQNAVVIASYEPAMKYRYLLQTEGHRPDVSIVISRSSYTPQQTQQLFFELFRQGRPIYLPTDETIPAFRSVYEKGTEPDVAAAGFLRFRPIRADRAPRK